MQPVYLNIFCMLRQTNSSNTARNVSLILSKQLLSLDYLRLLPTYQVWAIAITTTSIFVVLFPIKFRASVFKINILSESLFAQMKCFEQLSLLNFSLLLSLIWMERILHCLQRTLTKLHFRYCHACHQSCIKQCQIHLENIFLIHLLMGALLMHHFRKYRLFFYFFISVSAKDMGYCFLT